jgi:5-methylcytosine-specific restriction endonuclease McrA
LPAGHIDQLPTDDSVAPVAPCVPSLRTPERDPRRKVPLGLRFRIFQRDDFSCVLCGASPAKGAMTQLHADHIVPWSKGGKTAADNLRTLCDSCNIGRGNAAQPESGEKG